MNCFFNWYQEDIVNTNWDPKETVIINWYPKETVIINWYPKKTVIINWYSEGSYGVGKAGSVDEAGGPQVGGRTGTPEYPGVGVRHHPAGYCVRARGPPGPW